MKNKLKKLKKDWQSYIMNGILSSETEDYIKDAWDRCFKMNIDYNDGRGKIIPDDELEIKFIENKKLIEIATPIMENIFEIIKSTNYSVILTDKEGVLIHVITNKDIENYHKSLNFVLGTYWNEENVGSNGIGTCLFLDKPVQFIGAQHFCLSHHDWTCSSAPIHDSSGKIIGCIDISGKVEDVHIHTFGIVTTTAKIIEKQIDISNSYELMNTTFNSILEGLIVIDENYKVSRYNERILDILKLDKDQLLQLDIRNIFRDVDLENKVFKDKKNIRFSEFSFEMENSRIECLLNISPFVFNGKVKGAVILVKEAEQVRKVVNHIVGYKSNYTFDDIITNNEKFKNIIAFSKKISKTNCSVLIQGESGTGKELFAHSIHNYSNRNDGPFIAINCAALPKDLVESELFGYEKGSFTGASKEGKPGKFELANGGTIFLDEIGELSLETQSKLLRILESNHLNRIGSNYERIIDVRVIAATNRNLIEEVESKTFREDLFYRLNVININLTPLRERPEDILDIAENILKNLNNNDNNGNKIFAKSFKDKILIKEWKGNVRELQNYIKRAYYMSEENLIADIEVETNIKSNEYISNSKNMKDIEKNLIIQVLNDYNGNVIKTSNQLNIGKSTIYRKIKDYEIDINKYKN